MRTLLALAFIGGIGGLAAYLAGRPTIARGDVLGAGLLEAHQDLLRRLDCDPEIPIGVEGAHFGCRAEYRDGSVQQIQFAMDRAGIIRALTQGPRTRVKGATDPWGD